MAACGVRVTTPGRRKDVDPGGLSRADVAAKAVAGRGVLGGRVDAPLPGPDAAGRAYRPLHAATAVDGTVRRRAVAAEGPSEGAAGAAAVALVVPRGAAGPGRDAQVDVFGVVFGPVDPS